MAEDKDIRQEVEIKFDTNADQVAKKVDTLDKSISKTTESTTASKKSSDSASKGFENLGGGIGSAVSGFKALIKQMYLLLANPVGLFIAAIAVALTTLYKAFTSTNDGADKMEQIMSGLSAVIDVLRDRFLKIIDVAKKLFSGDIIGAAKEYFSIFSGVGDEIAAEFKKAAAATKSLQEVDDAMRALGVTRAKLNRDLVEAKEIIEDENASYADKKIAIEKVQKAEGEQTKQELANAEKKLKAIKELNALSDTSDKDLQAEADAEAALYDIQKKSSEDKIKNIKLTKKADREEETRLKEISAQRKEAAKARAEAAKKELEEVKNLANEKIKAEDSLLKRIQDVNDKTEEEKLQRQRERALEEIAILEQKGIDTRNLLIYNDELYNTLEDELVQKRAEEKAEKEKIAREKAIEEAKKQAEEEKKIEEAKLAQIKAIEDAKKGILVGAINLAKDIFSKNKKIQKGILIAENAAALSKITMNTVEAVSKDNAASPLTFGMPWSGIHIAQGAIGAANVIASTAKGLKELGGGSVGTAPNISGARGASAAPQVGFQASSENQIATTIAANTNEQPPVEAFIVESTVTTAQALARKKIESNSF